MNIFNKQEVKQVINTKPLFMTFLFLFAVVVLAILSFQGCSKYPFGIKKENWDALSREQQINLLETQLLLDQYHYDSDKCNEESEIFVETKVGNIADRDKIKVRLGTDKKLFEMCMRQRGWSDEKLKKINN